MILIGGKFVPGVKRPGEGAGPYGGTSPGPGRIRRLRRAATRGRPYMFALCAGDTAVVLARADQGI